MIAHLTGTVLKKREKQIIISLQGVGYLVQVGNDVLSSTEEKAEISLFIHTKVKEDELSLFGFVEEPELLFFQQLIGVSGIGAKTAMAILSLPLSLTQKAIEEEDISYLSKVPGLGKKTASRLVLELKGKISISIDTLSKSTAPRSLQEEALQALETLGYDKPSIIRFLNTTDANCDSAEELVRSFLQNA